MSAKASMALAIATALVAVDARAEDAVACVKPEQGSPSECARVTTFTSTATSTLIPNNWIHFTLSGFSHFAWNYVGTGGFREIPGFGLLLGVAPLDSQRLRFSAGTDITFGPTPDASRHEVAIEPRMRVSFGDIEGISSALPIDFFVNGVVPIWLGEPRVGAGGGGGAAVRLLNRVACELGYEAVWTPTASPGETHVMHRATARIGIDIVSLIPNADNHVQKPSKRQAQIDLRCVLLDEAAAFRPEAPPDRPPVYCDDVLKALMNEEIADGERATAAFLRHVAPTQPAIAERLARTDKRLEGCRNAVMRQQRRCVDCTEAKIASWPSYVMDPHQIAEALGCIPRSDKARFVCDAAEANAAKLFFDACPR